MKCGVIRGIKEVKIPFDLNIIYIINIKKRNKSMK